MFVGVFSYRILYCEVDMAWYKPRVEVNMYPAHTKLARYAICLLVQLLFYFSWFCYVTYLWFIYVRVFYYRARYCGVNLARYGHCFRLTSIPPTQNWRGTPYVYHIFYICFYILYLLSCFTHKLCLSCYIALLLGSDCRLLPRNILRSQYGEART